MRRRLRFVLAGLVATLALALAWLLGTTAGARWVVARALAATPELSIEAVEGRLAGAVQLAGLRWNDTRTRVEAARIEARVAPAALMGGTLALTSLHAWDVHVVVDTAQEAATDDDASAPVELPRIRLDEVALSRVRVEVDGQVHDIQRVAGNVTLGGSRIDIGALELEGSTAQADGAITLDLARPLLLAAADLRGDVTIDGRRWTGTLAHAPGAQGESLAVSLAAPLEATLTGETASDGSRGRFALRAPQQSGAALGIDGVVAAELDLSLEDRRWTPRGGLRLGDDALSVEGGTLRLDEATLVAEALRIESRRHGTLRIDGAAPLGDAGTWSLRLAGDDLRWPRAGAPPLRIDGLVDIEGPAAAPQARPDVRLATEGLPAARIEGRVRRDGDAARFEGLRLATERGTAVLDGTLSFDGPATLDAALAGLDPALLAPDWPGAIDARLRFEGSVGADGATGVLTLRELGGQLRDRALSGEARIALESGRWREGRANLASGSAKLDGEASAAGRRFTLRAAVPDLADLWPGAAGAVDASWQRDGGDRIVLVARGIEVDGVRATRADVDLRAGAGNTGTVAARITAGGLALGQTVIESASLEVEGTRDAHVAALALRDGPRRVDARLDGGLRNDTWRGRLEGLEAEAPGATLRLREPAALVLGMHEARLSSACLDTTGGRLCLQATHAGDAGEATADLDGLSLAALRGWIADPRVPALEGLASGTAMARWDAGGLREASARLDSPRGLAVLPDRPDLDLGYDALAIDATWADDAGRVAGSARLVPSGRIDLAAELTRVDAAIGFDATLDVHVTDLSGIEAFTTAIAEPEGELRGQLRVRGGALPPSLSGALALTGFTAQVPGQALRLRDGVLVLAGVPGQLVLRGNVVSGDGTLAIDGRIDRDDPVPALLRLGGQRVRVSNTPTLSLLASPDLTLALRDGRWLLEGKVDIPRARIDASKLESGVDRSPDVVVVDDPEPPDPRRPWRARVKVGLGDDVRLTGFGFDGSLQGALDVTQRQGAQALASGEVTLLGRYAAYGQRLDIKRGGLRWANSPLAEPTLDLRAERKVRGETVALEVRGSASNPSSSVIAGPGVSDSEALSLLVTGRPLNRAGAEDRERLSDAAAALGAVGSELLTRGLRGRMGLDEIGISNDTRLDGEAFTLGKYLSPRLYVGYGIGLLTRGEVFTVRYLVTDRIEIEANAGATQRAAVNWRIER